MQASVEQRYPPDRYSYPSLKELVLDGTKLRSLSSDDSQFLSTFQNLISLSCSCTGLLTLSGFPSLPSLKKLELQDNFLGSNNTSGFELLPSIAPNLRVLRLGGNKLKSANELIKYLKPLKGLEVLDVEKNIFNANDDSQEWRSLFFVELPQLKSVDSKDVAGKEYNDDDDDEEDESIEDEEEDDDDDDDDDADTLKAFYEKDYDADIGDEDDQDEFNPLNCQEEDEEEFEEEDEDDEEEATATNGSESHKRPTPDTDEEELVKKQKV